MDAYLCFKDITCAVSVGLPAIFALSIFKSSLTLTFIGDRSDLSAAICDFRTEFC